MSRHIMSLSQKQLTSFDLNAFMTHVAALNQYHRAAFITLFPKASSRWLSHYQFIPRPLACTTADNVEGGLSWLVGPTIDIGFTSSICAPSYGARGGPRYDPASLVVLEVTVKVDQNADYARFCDDYNAPRKLDQ